MLERIEPGEFDWWVAYERLEPDPTERIVEILKLGFAGLCNCWGAKVEPDYFDPKPKEPVEVAPQQAVAMLRQAYGG